MLKQPTPETVNAYLAGLKADADLPQLGTCQFFPKGQAKTLPARLCPLPIRARFCKTCKPFCRYWPKAMQELCVKDGLPMSAQLAANHMPREAAKLLMDGAKDKDFQKNALKSTGDPFARTDFDAEVNKQMGEFNATLLGGGDQSVATEVNKSVATLAPAIRQSPKNLDYKDAIRKRPPMMMSSSTATQSTPSTAALSACPRPWTGMRLSAAQARRLRSWRQDLPICTPWDYRHLSEHAPKMYGSLLKAAGRAGRLPAMKSGLVFYGRQCGEGQGRQADNAHLGGTGQAFQRLAGARGKTGRGA